MMAWRGVRSTVRPGPRVGAIHAMAAATPRQAVVFLHGIVGADFIRALWPSFQYFRLLDRRLADFGVPLYFPGAPSAATIETRAGFLAAALAQIPADTLHLVAHSMGGLDARYLIHHHDAECRIRSLTTVGSPHRGSPLVQWVMDTNGLLQWFSRRFLVPGLHELTPEACARFNEQVPDRADVVYRSYAGCRPVGEMPWLYREPTRVLQRLEGDNDSQVSVASARWGDFRGTVRADHLELTGWSFGLPNRRAQRPFDHGAFYRRIVGELLG